MAKKSKQVVKEEDADAMETSQVEGKSEKSSYDELLNHVSIIAKPMASRKLTKRIYKLLKKGLFVLTSNHFLFILLIDMLFSVLAAPHKGYVRNGLKDVQRRIRLGEKG